MAMNVNKVSTYISAIAGIALVMIVMIILFANLGQNTGLKVDSQGYNDTQRIIGNVTTGFLDGAKLFPTIMTFVFLALMFAAIIGIVVLIRKKVSAGRKGSMGE